MLFIIRGFIRAGFRGGSDIYAEYAGDGHDLLFTYDFIELALLAE